MIAREYLTLAELEAIAFKHPGFPILAYGDEWVLTVPVDGKTTTYRAKSVTA